MEITVEIASVWAVYIACCCVEPTANPEMNKKKKIIK